MFHDLMMTCSSLNCSASLLSVSKVRSQPRGKLDSSQNLKTTDGSCKCVAYSIDKRQHSFIKFIRSDIFSSVLWLHTQSDWSSTSLTDSWNGWRCVLLGFAVIPLTLLVDIELSEFGLFYWLKWISYQVDKTVWTFCVCENVLSERQGESCLIQSTAQTRLTSYTALSVCEWKCPWIDR